MQKNGFLFLFLFLTKISDFAELVSLRATTLLVDCDVVQFMVEFGVHFRRIPSLSSEPGACDTLFKFCCIVFFFFFTQFQLLFAGGVIRSSHMRELLDLFPIAAVIVGVTSFAYHASYTWFFQFWDFVGMYVFLGLPITINLLTIGAFNRYLKRRVFGVLSAPLAFYIVYVVLFSASVIVFKHFNIKFQMVTLSQMLLVAFQFVQLARDEQFRHVATPVFAAFVCFVLAVASNLLDQNGTWCDPTSWLQGHSVWHFWAAMALVYIWRVHYLISRAISVGQIKD
jgi:hypothetical protein